MRSYQPHVVIANGGDFLAEVAADPSLSTWLVEMLTKAQRVIGHGDFVARIEPGCIWITFASHWRYDWDGERARYMGPYLSGKLPVRVLRADSGHEYT